VAGWACAAVVVALNAYLVASIVRGEG
jgi:hypothetical protein